MYSLTTYNTTEKKLYLSKSTLTANKKLIYNYCNFTNSTMMKRHLNKLIDKNLIEEKDDNYYFPQNPSEKYRILDKEMLFYLTTTRNVQTIRVYIILLDCYLWKLKENSHFEFTNTYLLDKLGYSTTNKLASSAISNILESLSREGIIEYKEVYGNKILPNGKEVPTPKKILTFVAKSKNELKN